jgi:hypothetical protein
VLLSLCKQTYSLNSTIIFMTCMKSYQCFPVFFTIWPAIKVILWRLCCWNGIREYYPHEKNTSKLGFFTRNLQNALPWQQFKITLPNCYHCACFEIFTFLSYHLIFKLFSENEKSSFFLKSPICISQLLSCNRTKSLI